MTHQRVNRNVAWVWFVIGRCTHLEMLSAICHLLDHVCSLIRSDCRMLLSVSEMILQYMMLSSAKSHMDD